MALQGQMRKRKKDRKPVGVYRPPEGLDYSLTKMSDSIDYGLDSFSDSIAIKKRKRKEKRFESTPFRDR